MNMVLHGVAGEAFPSPGLNAPSGSHATVIDWPLPTGGAGGWPPPFSGAAGQGGLAGFERFAFQSLPIFARDGLWISQHLGASDGLFAEAWRILTASFADYEQRGYREQLATLRLPRYRFSAIGFGDAVVGVLGVWDLPGFRFIEHVAISEAHRSSGFGGRALRLLQQHLGGVVALDVEPASAGEEAVRRVSFYARHGFHLDAQPVTLPPYDGKATGPSHLMVWPHALRPDSRAEMVSQIRGEIYGGRFDVRPGTVMRQRDG